MHYNTAVPTRSLYIHWPFCPYKCHYCPFVAIASHDQFMTQYHEALKAEIEEYAAVAGKQQLDTIYFGGGTPSTYPNDLLLDTFGILKSKFCFDEKTEVTIEVNPGTVDTGSLAVWKQCGINRLSIGVQSLNDKVLRSLNRLQTAEQVHTLLKDASANFDNISVDLILGLPDIGEEEWRSLLQAVVTWPITHISMYFLTVHEKTPLYFKVKTNKVTLPCDDAVVDLYYWSRDFLESHGFNQYEISSFAKTGYQSRHNTVYWEHKPYKGVGLGACSFDGTSRFQNEKNLMKYIGHDVANERVMHFAETLTSEQVRLEKLMLGLRRSTGVTWAILTEGMSGVSREQLHTTIERLKQNGFLIQKDDRFILTPRGLAVENEVVTTLSL